MQFTHLKLKNWRNFTNVDLALGERMFITGPNASGKSNLLDVFRFLRDIAKKGGKAGGLQYAIKERKGLTKLRCLAARKNPQVEIEVSLKDGAGIAWRYGIGLTQETRGNRNALLSYEKVWKDEKLILDRPNADDKADSLRLTETHLEQVNANKEFRCLADEFQKILYLHLVPQLLKFPELANKDAVGEDPFGVKFLERIMETPEKTRKSRLNKIEGALRLAVPELSELKEVRDERGFPHLEAVYTHWRPNGGRQREDQFSDGTLRLIGLLWTLLDGDSLLLLEEPELSLHTAIVSKLPGLIWRMQRTRGRQVFISSHSAELLGDKGVAGSEVALLKPRESEGTEVKLASGVREIRLLLESGMTVAEAVLPMTAPETAHQLLLWKE